MFGWFKKNKKTDTPLEPSPPPHRNLDTEMLEMLRSHGLNAKLHDGWACVNGAFPALGATCYLTREDDTMTMVQINFELILEDGRHIVESYAGWGDDARQAEGQGLFKFCVGAMHVFLSAFWDHHEPDQVDLEHWTIDDKRWTAYLSSLINNASKDQKVGYVPDYMETLQQAISRLPLTNCEHWVSVYLAMDKTDMTVDVRLDNEISPDLTEVVRTMDWPIPDGFYSRRQFILLRPASA